MLPLFPSAYSGAGKQNLSVKVSFHPLSVTVKIVGSWAEFLTHLCFPYALHGGDMRIDQAASGLSKQMCFKQGTPPARNPQFDLSLSSLKVISYLTC